MFSLAISELKRNHILIVFTASRLRTVACGSLAKTLAARPLENSKGGPPSASDLLTFGISEVIFGSPREDGSGSKTIQKYSKPMTYRDIPGFA